MSDHPLIDAIRACADRPHAAFYTPGHKRGQEIAEAIADLIGSQAFHADLPELPGLDNLFNPDGVIQAAQAQAAHTFGAEQTWFLTNGSTCGIEAAVLAACRPGEKLIVPRNVHQSVISALILSGAVPVFVQPDYDAAWGLAHGLSVEAVARALDQHPDAKAVMVVYPTYYGVGGDLEAIATFVHAQNLPLLVDEAHGPHFAFHPELPPSALAAGADLTVQSTHKVLSALTQASMLHLQGDRLSPHRIRQALQLVQSSSPSYLLLASLEAACYQMAEAGPALMTRTLSLAQQARTQIAAIAGLRVFELNGMTRSGAAVLDPTRLTVDVTGLGLTGFEADEILHHQLGVTAELPTLTTLTFIISLGNTDADIQRLVEAFRQLAQSQLTQSQLTQSQLTQSHLAQSHMVQPGEDCSTKSSTRSSARNDALRAGALGEDSFGDGSFGDCSFGDRSSNLNALAPFPSGHSLLSVPEMSPREAFFAETETVAIAQAVGHISAELVCPYPPGIPALLPGERITGDTLEGLQQVIRAGGVMTGCADDRLETLAVVRQN